MSKKFIYILSMCCFCLLEPMSWTSPATAMEDDEREEKTTHKPQKPSEAMVERGWKYILRNGCATVGTGIVAMTFDQNFQGKTPTHNFIRESTGALAEAAVIGGVLGVVGGTLQANVGVTRVVRPAAKAISDVQKPNDEAVAKLYQAALDNEANNPLLANYQFEMLANMEVFYSPSETQESIANAALGMSGHRTSETFLSQGKWWSQSNHQSVSEWFSGVPSRNSQNAKK